MLKYTTVEKTHYTQSISMSAMATIGSIVGSIVLLVGSTVGTTLQTTPKHNVTKWHTVHILP